MKQIRPEKKGGDSKKQIPITQAQKVVTKGTYNFKLGGRKDKRNASEPILTEREWGDISLAWSFGTHSSYSW
jgi:hypothetical protein